MRSPSARPPLGGTLIPLQHHRQQGDAAEASAGLGGPCAPGGKRRCDRIARPNLPPRRGWQIVNRQPDLPVLGQALCGLGSLPCLSSPEEVKRLRSPLAIWRPPAGVAALWGL